MIKKILKVLFILALLFVLAVVSLFACLFFRIPLWWSIIIFVGIIVAYYVVKWLFKLFRRYIRRRRLGEDDEEQPADQTFEKSFNNALLHSKNYHKEHRKKLPWYMLLGNLDSGKSSLVNGSRVYTLSENIDPNAEVLPTQTAHCWALDHSVIAETSGAMFLAKPSRIALRAWKKLTHKVKLHRRHIKLKGFVATVSVDQLQGDADALAQYAQDLRQKVENCSKQMGFSYPVYIIITKTDRIQGFESFSLGLPEEVRQQAFGKLFNDNEFHTDSAILVNEWQRYLADRIRGFNTLQLQANNSLLPRVMLFNNQLQELKNPLTKFLNTFFRVSAQIKADNPVLRGMFLTSAKQEAGSEVLDKGSILEGLSIGMRSRSGTQDLFIHDIFASILPRDYYLYNRFSKKIMARRRYYRQAIGAWWFIFIGSSVYLGIAYAHAIKALVEINQVSKVRENQFSDKLSYNLLLLSNMYQDISVIEGINENWFFSVWPYSQAFDDIVLGSHLRFVSQFNKYVRDDLKAALVQSADIVIKPNHKQNFGFVVQNIVEKINLIQAKLDLMPESAIESLNMNTLLISDDFKTNNYGILYKSYISWNTNLIQLKQQRGELLKLLDSLDLFDKPFGWLTSWVDEVSNIQPITAGTYWPENKFPTQYLDVKPVYTQEGYKLIQALFNNIANVQLQPTEVEQYSLKFFAEYDLQRYKVWEQFAYNFRQDVEYIPSEAAWYATAQLPLTESPYYYYANTLHENFTDKMLLDRPEWLTLFFKLDQYYEKSLLAITMKEKVSWWEGFINYLDRYTRDFKARVDGVFYDDNLIKAMNAYELALIKLQKYVLTLDQESSFNVTATLFSDTASSPLSTSDSKDAPKSDQGDFYKAFNAYQQLKFFAANDFNLVNKNRATWNLFKGMFDLYFHGVIEKSMCYVGQMWKNKVINNPENSVVNNTYSLEELFGQKSNINQFMVKYVYPFIMYQDSKQSYVPKLIFGHSYDFTPFVYDYARDQYAYVKLQMLQKRIENIVKGSQELIQAQIKPTNVNDGAKLLPDSTTVSVVCSGKKQVYNNYDMVSNIALTNDIFKCTYAEVSINFEGAADFSAVKKYNGTDGLLELVNDYAEDGKVSYKASDFPDVYSQLQNYNVNDMTVFIDFQGLNAIKSLLIDYTSKKAALTAQVYGKLADWKYLDIVSCWGDQVWENPEVSANNGSSNGLASDKIKSLNMSQNNGLVVSAKPNQDVVKNSQPVENKSSSVQSQKK